MIHHVTRAIPASRLDDCIEFYAVLGFRPVSEPPGIAGRAVWLDRAGTQIHLMPAEDAVPEQGHVAVVVEGYDATLERLRQRGVEIDPRKEHWGSPRAFVRDPAGNTVELMAWPPGEAPGEAPGAAGAPGGAPGEALGADGPPGEAGQ